MGSSSRRAGTGVGKWQQQDCHGHQRCDANQSNRNVVRTRKCTQVFPGLLSAPPYHMSLCFRCKNEEGLGEVTGTKGVHVMDATVTGSCLTKVNLLLIFSCSK